MGVVVALYRFPVKSMRAEPTEEAQLRWHGLAGDRRYAFVRGDDTSSFPWLTGRQVSQLVSSYAPYFADRSDPHRGPVRVRTPAGEDHPVEGEELLRELSAAYGGPTRLLQCNRGTFDSSAISLLTLPTVRALEAESGLEIDPLRFRANVLIEPTSAAPYQEEAWLGDRLVFGKGEDAAWVRANNKIARCVMVNIDPETAERDARVLRHVARERENGVGIYGSTERPGAIRVGDAVYREAAR